MFRGFLSSAVSGVGKVTDFLTSWKVNDHDSCPQDLAKNSGLKQWVSLIWLYCFARCLSNSIKIFVIAHKFARIVKRRFFSC